MKKIAISGAGGKIGREICRYLKQMMPNAEIRIGSRNESEKIIQLMNEIPNMTWRQVDVENPESLKRFVEGQDLLINAVGPAGKYAQEIMRIVLPICHVVEVGYHPVFERQIGENTSHWGIFGAGCAPGFIGLLCRKMMEAELKINHWRLWYLIREALSMSAALDLADNFTSTSRKKERMSLDGANQPVGKSEGSRLPLFSETVHALRYYDQEAKEIDTLYGVKESELYLLWDEDMLELAGKYAGNSKAFAEQLCNLSKVALLSRKPLLRIVAEFSTENTEAETVVLQAPSQSALSGCTAAATALAALEELEGVPGIYRASGTVFWKKIWNWISKTDIFSEYEVYSRRLEDFDDDETGEI